MPAAGSYLPAGRVPFSQNTSLYFFLLGGLGIFVAAGALFLPAFAEPAREVPATVSHTRAIVESVHVVSVMGNAGNVPVAHVRVVSDSVGVSSAFSQNTGQQGLYRSHTPTSAGTQRIEERTVATPLQQRTGTSAGARASHNVIATPVIVSGPPDMGPGDGGEDPPDDSDTRYMLLSESSVAAGSSYQAVAYGAMSIAVVVLSVRSSGALGISAAHRRYVLVFSSLAASQYSSLGRGARIALLAGLAAAAVSAAGAGVLEASADSPAGIAYRIGTSGGLGYREWDPATSSWSAEASLTSAGSQIEAVRFLYSPAAGSELRVIAVRETNGEIDIYYCTADCTNAASWNGPNLVVDMGSPTGGRKYFDIAFEQSSGDLLIVYTRTTSTETNDFFYQVFDSDTLTLSGESGFDYIDDTTANNDIRFFQTASKPGSDEIAMALLDATNNDLVAFIWDGSSFGNQLTVTDAVPGASLVGESFGVAYESASGAALVVGPGLSASEVRYARYAGSWSAVSTLAGGINPDITGDDPVWMTVKPDPNPGSNKIMACSVDDAADFSCVQFDAGTPGTPIRHEAALGASSSRRGDFAWDGGESTGLALWYDNGAGSYQYSRWDSSTSTWNAETSTAVAQTLIWVVAVADQDLAAGIDSLWAFYSQASPDNIGDGEYDSTTFTLNGLGTISTDAGTANTDDVVSLDSRRPRSLSDSTADSVAVSDAITAKISGRGVPDSQEIQDSVSRVYLQPRPAADSVAFSDSISTSVFSPGNAKLSDSVSIADGIKTTVSRSVSDTLSAGDSATKQAVKPISDSVTAADGSKIHAIKVVPDSLDVADLAGRLLEPKRSAQDSVTVADSIPSDSNAAGIAYRSNTGSGTSFPKYREWNPKTFAWSQEVELPSAGSAVRVAWIEFSPVSSKRVIVTLADDGFLDSYACDDLCTQAGSWTVQNNVAQVRASLSGIERPFDIEYENTSGDLVLVYDKVSTDSSQDLFYRVMADASSTFGSENSINDSTSSDTDVAYTFMRMDSRKTAGSDAIGLIALDSTNSDAVAWVWDGSSWGSEHELTSTLSITNTELIDVAYESSSGNLMVAAGEGADVRYNRFTTSWQTSSTSAGTWGVGNVNWLNLVPNPEASSNEIFLAATGSLSDLDSAYWDGSSWTDHAEHDDALGGTAGSGFDFAWDGGTSAGIMIWRTTAGQLDFKRFTAPGSFSAQGFFLETANHNWVQLATNPDTADYVSVLGATIDTNNDIGGIRWDGGAYDPVSTGDNAITAVGLDTYESFHVDFQKAQRISKPADDEISIGTSASRALVAVRPISDSIAVAEDPRGHIPTQLAESLAIGDSITKYVSKSMSDSLSPSESVNIQFEGQFSVSVSNIVSVADGITRLRVSPAAIPDSVGVSDALVIEIRLSPSDTVALADSASREKASVASSSKAGAAYRSNTGASLLQSPKYREWDPSTQSWSSEVELPSTGSDVRDAKVLFSPTSSLRVIVSLSADGSLNLFKCDSSCTASSSWTHVGGASFANVGTLSASNPYRPFDMAFEQDTGRLLVAYDKGLTENADFYYRTFDGATLSAESSYSFAGSAGDAEEVRYFRMASKPSSSEIAMIIQDATNANSYALVWDGSSFGNQLTVSTSIGSAGLDGGSIGVAYETASGSAVVFSASGTNVVAYARWSGGSWSSVSTTDPNTPSGGNNMKFVRLAANPAVGSNEIMVCQADDVSDLSCAVIDAGVLGGWTIHDTGITTVARRTFDFVWNPSGSAGLLVWGTSAGSISYKVYGGSGWGPEQTVSSAGGKQWVVGAASPSPDDVVNSLFLVLNSNLDIGTFKSKSNVLTLISESTHTANTGVNTFEAMSIDFQKSSRVNVFVSDAVALSEALSKSVSKPVADALAVAASLEKILLPSVSDSLALLDSVSKAVPKTPSDPLSISDSVAAKHGIFQPVAEPVLVADAVSAVPIYRVSDPLSVVDSIEAKPSSNLEDFAGIQDAISIVVAKSLSDSLATADGAERNAAYQRSALDGTALADSIEGKSTTLIFDSLGVSDAVNVSRTVDVGDFVGLGDDLKLKVSDLRFGDQISVTDTIGIAITIPIADGMVLTDLALAARAIDIADSVGIAAVLADVTWSRTVALDEGLGLSGESCTPVECSLNLNVSESLALVDEWVPPPTFDEVVTILDGIAASTARPAQISESLAASDKPETALEAAPPVVPANWDLTEMPRAVVVTDASLVEPPEASELPGTYDISGGLGSLLLETGMPVYSTSQMLSATDTTGKTLVLPLFQVSTTPTDDMPARNGILTPVVDVLPADTAISIPVDIKSTLSEEAVEHPVNWMKIDYTPGFSGTNFALMVSMLDTKPASAQSVQAEVSAFFIDVDWAGAFAGPQEPSDPAFYTKKPDLTFAITDEWASSQNLARDQNGVPVMELFLLNDSTGQWEKVQSIDSPAAAIGGQYAYVAHLEHFSTYVATSTKAKTATGQPTQPSLLFSALLSDSVSVSDAQEVRALEFIEEFTGSRNVRAMIADVLEVGSKPIAFGETLQVGRDVRVAIALDDIYTASILPPEVRATLVLAIENGGDSAEKFRLHVRYFDESGRLAYEHAESIEIGPRESSQQVLQVPFTSAGDFVIDLDARAEDDNEILGTAQIALTVPWLAVNTHVIIGAAAAILAGAGAMMAYILRRQKASEDAQVT